MDEFECLLSENKSAVEHFVLFRISTDRMPKTFFRRPVILHGDISVT